MTETSRLRRWLNHLCTAPNPSLDTKEPAVPQIPQDVAEQIAEQRRRIDQLAAERAADDPTAPGVDPGEWRRRQADRSRMEVAAVERIEQLTTGARNDAAFARTYPNPPRDRCTSCGRRLGDASRITKIDGPCCITCADRTPAERASYRAVRAVPVADIRDYLDGLPEPDLAELFHIVGRHDQVLRGELDQAVRRRHQRATPGDTPFVSQRKRLAEKLRHAADLNDSVRAAWFAINDALSGRLAPAAHIDKPATRKALDTLDVAGVNELRQVAVRMRDHVMLAVVAAEQRRRRTGGGHVA